MASNRTVYHVVPSSSGEQWVVSCEKDDTFRAEYGTKEEAVGAAKELARGEEPSQVKVYERGGDMENESFHGADPSRSPS